jgi:DNA polymerase
MRVLSIDIETYSEADLTSEGAYKYVEDEHFSVLLFGFSIDYSPAKVIDLTAGQEIPQQIIEAMTDPRVTKTAFNANFERTALSKHFGKSMPPDQWECTMVLAAQAGLPLSLAAVSMAMNLPEDKAKLKHGKELIRYFCLPCKATKANGGRTRNQPFDDLEKWAAFVEYCGRDVEAENYIRQHLLKHNLRPTIMEQRLWALDQKINDVGVPVNLVLTENAINIDERFKEGLEARAIAVSGITNPNSATQVKAWLEEVEGIPVDSLNKKAMPELMDKIQTDEANEFLTIRKELSKSSTMKYNAIRRSVCSDGKIRGLFQFYGANRTGRFAGRLVQVQNLPQNHLPDLELARDLVLANDYTLLELLYGSITSTLSELIRTAMIPEPGCRFIVADYSAIEARVIAYFAKEEWVLEEFRGEGKIYEATAAQMFHVDKKLIVRGNKEYDLRAKGKVAVLALGYQGGANALKTMGALDMGIKEDELAGIVKLWRNANKNIVRWWASLEEAAINSLTDGSSTDEIGGIRFRYSDKNLFMDLPSGRSLCYREAKTANNRFGGLAIHFKGMNQVTKRWEDQDTYGGKLAENCVQAVARDCLLDAMYRLDARGFDIRMHVHDEVVINEPIGGRSVKQVCDVMAETIPWAAGLPLQAAGFETEFYRKD